MTKKRTKHTLKTPMGTVHVPIANFTAVRARHLIPCLLVYVLLVTVLLIH